MHGPTGSVPGVAITTTVHPESGWQPAPARGGRSRGQDRPEGEAALLNAIYEEEFSGSLKGSGPAQPARCAGRADGRDQQQEGELHAGCRYSIVLRRGQSNLVDPLRGHRIGDRRIVRLIRKWLKAGVLEDGAVMVSETGTGQGSVISPLLANVYLHDVFDLWASAGDGARPRAT